MSKLRKKKISLARPITYMDEIRKHIFFNVLDKLEYK